MTELSIIILNYNTKILTLDAISSIEKNYPKEVMSGKFEVIVTDNASSDGSIAAFQEYKKKTKITSFHIVDNEGNIGFSAGNNIGVSKALGKYILFLNSDTIVYPKTLQYMLGFMKKNPDAGAATCKLINRDGEIDFNCHRGFPTPWNSLCYFSGLTHLFPHSRFFAGYTQGWKDMDTTHVVDAIEGAFMLISRKVGEKVHWWDEDYFFYGEDLQLCFDIKKLGYKIYYVPQVSIMHIGGVSSGIKKETQNVSTATHDTKRRIQLARFDAMKLFYKKNYVNKYPKIVTWLVIKGIDYKLQKALQNI